jgi:hypothetical protein
VLERERNGEKDPQRKGPCIRKCACA